MDALLEHGIVIYVTHMTELSLTQTLEHVEKYRAEHENAPPVP